MPALKPHPEARMPVEQVTSEALQLTELLLADLRLQLEAIDQFSMKDRQQVSGLLTKLMRAAATMIKEARALIKDQHSIVEGMSYAEQAKLIVEVVERLPPEFVKDLRKELGW